MTPGLVKLKIASGKFRCSSRDRPRNYQNPPVTGNLTVFLLPVVGSSRERERSIMFLTFSSGTGAMTPSARRALFRSLPGNSLIATYVLMGGVW
ncbi:hypothetical protein BgiMline_014906 [Biomphalaria glabrata]|nr:hypothetical protein BgiMline_022039 [Biomphalaria glabrata]